MELSEALIILMFPLTDSQVTCGKREDLPKKDRKHIPVLLGPDVRNKGDKGFIERDIFACLRCGKDFDRPPGYRYPSGHDH